MKLMFASDIHGSSYYCNQLVEAFNIEKPDKLLLLGDLLYHGPRNELPKGYEPKQVISMLNPLSDKIICVRGNCDTEVDQMVLDFPILADYSYLYIDGKAFFATHGHIFNEVNPPKCSKGDILLNGHTHIPKFTRYKDFIYVNCGSVSIPKENTPHSYMIFENNTLFWKNLYGEIYRMEYVEV